MNEQNNITPEDFAYSQDVIKKLSESGVTIIMSLHELELALMISDRVLLVQKDGETVCEEPSKVISSGIIKELYELTDDMYERVEKQLIATCGENSY